MNDDLWAVLLGVTLAQGVVLVGALTFLPRYRGSAANRILTLLVLLTLASNAEYLLLVTGLAKHFPHYSLLPIAPLVPPLYYFYARAMLEPGFSLRWIYSLHALPSLAELIHRRMYLRLSGSVKASFLETLRTTIYTVSLTDLIPFTLYIVQALVYALIVHRHIRAHERRMLQTSAGSANDHLMMVRWLNFAFFLFVAVATTTLIYMAVLRRYTVTLDYAVALTMCLVVQTVSFAALTQPRAFANAVGEPAPDNRQVPDAALAEVKERLLAYMKAEKPYLRPDLRVSPLAAEMGVPLHHLSQVIHAGLQTNFNDFVNGYRIAEVKRRLAEDEASVLTLAAIARDVGFGSRASFYRAFPRVTGSTPSAYIRGNRKQIKT